MSGIEDHASSGEAIDVRRVESGLRVIKFEIEGRLIVNEDEEDVGWFVLCVGKTNGEQKGEDDGFHSSVFFVRGVQRMKTRVGLAGAVM